MPGKTELIESVAEKTGVSKSQVSKILDETFSEIRSSLGKGEAVTLRGFGSFKSKTRAARKGRNPRTGAEIDIPESQSVSFKYSGSAPS